MSVSQCEAVRRGMPKTSCSLRQTDNARLRTQSATSSHVGCTDSCIYVHSLFKNDKFQNYLQAGRIVFDTYQEAHNVIENTDFGESVEYSSLGSHKSMKDYDIDTIMGLSNDAVLFAMLCQQYVQFKKQGV